MCAQEEKERDDDAKKADVSKPVIYMPRRYRNIDWDAIPKSDDAIVNDRDAQKQVGLARLRATAAAAAAALRVTLCHWAALSCCGIGPGPVAWHFVCTAHLFEII